MVLYTIPSKPLCSLRRFPCCVFSCNPKREEKKGSLGRCFLQGQCCGVVVVVVGLGGETIQQLPARPNLREMLRGRGGQLERRLHVGSAAPSQSVPAPPAPPVLAGATRPDFVVPPPSSLQSPGAASAAGRWARGLNYGSVPRGGCSPAAS